MLWMHLLGGRGFEGFDMMQILEAEAFSDMTPLAIGSVMLAHFIGFCIRGGFGFGSNLPIVLLTTWLLGPHHAILLVALTSGVAQFHLLPQGFRSADWVLIRRLTVGLTGGIALGVWTFASIEGELLILLMGVLIVLILLMDHFQLIGRIQKNMDFQSFGLITIFAGFSGAMGTITGGGGFYFLVAYLKLVCATPSELRGTSIFLSGAFMLFRLVLLAMTSLLTREILLEALVLTPAVLAGSWVGTRLFSVSSPERFYLVLRMVLLFVAGALLVKGFLSLIV